MIEIVTRGDRNLEQLSLHHYNNLKQLITERTNRFLVNNEALRVTIINNIEEILISKPARLLEIHHSISAQINDVIATQIFNYSNFKTNRRYNVYDLAQSLNVNVCVYCNRNYTNTVKNKIRPEFDHFFPKSIYPILQISFFNLIPSCNYCNSYIKGDDDLNIEEYIHPYVEGFDEHGVFDFECHDYDSMIGISKNLTLSFNIDNKSDKSRRIINSVNKFDLVNIYQNSHLDYLAEIIKMNYINDGDYIKSIFKSLSENYTKEEIYRLVYRNYYERELFDKRPLSKITYDIINKLQQNGGNL